MYLSTQFHFNTDKKLNKLYLPHCSENTMHMFNLPKVDAIGTKGIQVIPIHNSSKSLHWLFSVYTIHLISSFQAPHSDCTITGARHDVRTKRIHCHCVYRTQMANKDDFDVATTVPHFDRAISSSSDKILWETCNTQLTKHVKLC